MRFVPLLSGLALLGVDGQTLQDTLLAIDGDCEDVAGGITHVDWDDMMANAANAPTANLALDVNLNTVTMTAGVDADFVGWAYADNGVSGYGMMYMIDFAPADGSITDVRDAGTCSNRNAANKAAAWNDQWIYSSATDRDLDAATGAYSPTTNWALSTVEDGNCNDVTWTGTFSWFDLLDCGSNDGLEDYISLEESDTWVNMSGAVTVNLVSPLGLEESDFYRVYQLVSQPFIIAVKKTTEAVTSTGVNLFTVTIIAVYKEDLASDLEMVVLTESADFMRLDNLQILVNPNANNNLVPGSIGGQAAGTDITGGCMTTGGTFLCTQLFIIQAVDVPCPTDLSGTYTFQFDLVCNGQLGGYADFEATCLEYQTTYATSDGADPPTYTINLAADFQWVDNVCDPNIFLIQFTAAVNFYTDDTYTQLQVAPDQYNLGEMAYAEVVIGDPAAFTPTSSSLDQAWICTTHPDNLGPNGELQVDQNTGLGGCLNPSNDFSKHIVVNGGANQDPLDQATKDDGQLVAVGVGPDANTLRLEFPVEFTVERTQLFLHVQASIDITPNQRRRRRRRLLQDDVSSATAHFAGGTGIGEAVVIDEDGDDNDITGEGDDTNKFSIYEMIAMSVAATSVVCLAHFIVFGLCYRKKSQQRREMELNLQKSVESTSGSRTVPGTDIGMTKKVEV